MPKVSVIVPAYNAELYIDQCAKSILHQTLKDIEIIFIDDGSTDKTGEILDNLIKGYDNARVIHQENQGLYKTREIGLSLATGRYIGWVDADDFIEPEMYEILYNIADEKQSDLVICDYSWYPEKISTKGKWFREFKGIVDTTFVERNSQPWNKIVKRELIERLGISNLFTKCFDEIYILVLMEAKNPLTVKKQLYNYRVSFGTMSASYTNIPHARSFVDSSKELLKAINPQSKYWQDYFKYRIAYYLLMTMIFCANVGDKNNYLLNKREFRSMNPYKNQHYFSIILKNYGLIKGTVISILIPFNYYVARSLCKVGLK